MARTDEIATITDKHIIDALNEGLYVCDMNRRITYWIKSAERITGWSATDVIGRQRLDNVLCHIDKDGHKLCGEEYCPLHRSMVTGAGSFLKYSNAIRLEDDLTIIEIRFCGS